MRISQKWEELSKSCQLQKCSPGFDLSDEYKYGTVIKVSVRPEADQILASRKKPEKLFLRSASVGLAPGDGEQSPSPGPFSKDEKEKKQNRRESIKDHLMKFKAKAGKILEEKQQTVKPLNDEQTPQMSFVVSP